MADGKEDCTRLPLKRRRNQILNLSVSDLIDEDILLSDSGSEYHPESDCTDTSCENNEEASRRASEPMTQSIQKGDEADISGPVKTTKTYNNEAQTTQRCHKEAATSISVKTRRTNKRKENKMLRNQGKVYVTNEKTVHERELGPDCNCHKNCFLRVNEEERKVIMAEFWAMGDYNVQNAYLYGCLHAKTIKRKYTKSRVSRRKHTIEYTVSVEGAKITVCKVAFLSIHGLQKSRGRIEILAKRLGEGLNTPPLDKRGSHDSRANAYSHEQQELVIEHINKIPKYRSHYSRRDNMDKVYIGHEYSMASIYEDYSKVFCPEKGCNPVTKDRYKRIFRTLNIGFKHPKSDTCKLCDYYALKIKELRTKNTNLEELKDLETQRELHGRKAQAGMDKIKEFRQLAKEDDDLQVFTFDLQQALPIPKLSTGPAFYCRKLWGYNLNVHDCKNEIGYCYFWDEPTAGRGADEIISCLKKHFEKNNIRGKKLVMISDNCGGQNKNWKMVAFWSYLVDSGRFESIVHFFPTPGHTMLPSDQDFGHIEVYVRKHVQVVYTPEQWVEIIRKSCSRKPFHVYHMVQSDFVSFNALCKHFVFRKLNEDKNPVKFKETVTFEITQEQPTKLKVQHSYSGYKETVNLSPRGQHFIGSPKSAIFPNKYYTTRIIDARKMKDLQSLKLYIPQVYYESYYNKLKTGNRPEGELDDAEDGSDME